MLRSGFGHNIWHNHFLLTLLGYILQLKCLSICTTWWFGIHLHCKIFIKAHSCLICHSTFICTPYTQAIHWQIHTTHSLEKLFYVILDVLKSVLIHICTFICRMQQMLQYDYRQYQDPYSLCWHCSFPHQIKEKALQMNMIRAHCWCVYLDFSFLKIAFKRWLRFTFLFIFVSVLFFKHYLKACGP